jgi:hypothetical protein
VNPERATGLNAPANWYINQLATYGWPVLAITAITLIAAWCGLVAYLNRGRS